MSYLLCHVSRNQPDTRLSTDECASWHSAGIRSVGGVRHSAHHLSCLSATRRLVSLPSITYVCAWPLSAVCVLGYLPACMSDDLCPLSVFTMACEHHMFLMLSACLSVRNTVCVRQYVHAQQFAPAPLAGDRNLICISDFLCLLSLWCGVPSCQHILVTVYQLSIDFCSFGTHC